MVKYYKTSGGYFYKKLNNGDIKRISSKVYNNNVIKGGAGGGGGGGDASKTKLKNRQFELYITSNGYKSIIKAILNKEGYGKYFKKGHIITNEEFGTLNINNQLKLIDKSANKVLLIDDSRKNIDEAQKSGYRVYHVLGDSGIAWYDANNIGKLLLKNREIDTIVFDADLTFFSYDATSIFTNLYENSYKEISTKTKAMINNALKIFSNSIRESSIESSIYGVASGVDVLFDILGINHNANERNSITAVYGNNNLKKRLKNAIEDEKNNNERNSIMAVYGNNNLNNSLKMP